MPGSNFFTPRFRWVFLALLAFIVPAAHTQDKPKNEKVIFSFVVCSDLHMADNRAGEPTAVEKFKHMLERAKSIKPQPDFIVVTGDLHVEPFLAMLQKEKPAIPIHVTPGNHERRNYRELLEKTFPDDFKGKDFYSFRHKNVLFIMMSDAADNGDHVGHLDSEGIRGQDQSIWIEEQLASNPKGLSLLFAHIPMHPQGKAEGMYLATNDQKFLRELILKYKPAGLFFGHLHQRQEFKIGKSPVYVTPSLNWNFATQPQGFFAVYVYKDRIDPQFIRLNEK